MIIQWHQVLKIQGLPLKAKSIRIKLFAAIILNQNLMLQRKLSHGWYLATAILQMVVLSMVEKKSVTRAITVT
jgi:hypothetical protein